MCTQWKTEKQQEKSKIAWSITKCSETANLSFVASSVFLVKKIYGRLGTAGGEEQDLHGPAQVFRNVKIMVLIDQPKKATLFVPRRQRGRSP